jgi:hypothetical protein
LAKEVGALDRFHGLDRDFSCSQPRNALEALNPQGAIFEIACSADLLRPTPQNQGFQPDHPQESANSSSYCALTAALVPKATTDKPTTNGEIPATTANRAHPPPPNLFSAIHLQSPAPSDPDGCADCGFR